MATATPLLMNSKTYFCAVAAIAVVARATREIALSIFLLRVVGVILFPLVIFISCDALTRFPQASRVDAENQDTTFPLLNHALVASCTPSVPVVATTSE